MRPLPLIQRAGDFSSKTAIVANGATYAYEQLLAASHSVAAYLLGDRDDLHEARIAFLFPPGFEYVATQWGIWRSGGVAVPLSPMYPPPEWEYILRDIGASAIIADEAYFDFIHPIADSLSIRCHSYVETQWSKLASLPDVGPTRRAMILYTSGTTSKPKGVVTTHANIQAQVETLIDAWEWNGDDHILHTLPLHHVHGIINALTCALWAGAACEFQPRFNAGDVWQRIMNGGITLFMGVPTMYGRMIDAWEKAPSDERNRMTAACRSLRLMVSGSAALPVSTLEKWKSLSGHVLLERYGMTEIGMALSNPLHGERAPGHVGSPLPSVEVQLVDEAGAPVEDGTPGEIEVRGPSVFLEYWQTPDATREAFRNGWFRTGDMAVRQSGMYRILGRTSVDIIKTGGYKVSALEIEEVLRTHPAVGECAVVGVEDEQWGERVVAAVVPKEGSALSLDQLRDWAKQYLATYKVPRQLMVLDDLPRNAMGKVTKPDVVKMIGEER